MSEIVLARSAPPHTGSQDIAVPRHSLARRSRGWTLWLGSHRDAPLLPERVGQFLQRV